MSIEHKKGKSSGKFNSNLDNPQVNMFRMALLTNRNPDLKKELLTIERLERVIKLSDEMGRKTSPSAEFRRALAYHKLLVEAIIAVKSARAGTL